MRKTALLILSFAILASIGTMALPADAQGIGASENPAKAASTASGRPRVGLALGGGGSRGSSHVGVLKVLKEEHIPIDIIAGTSIGSVVGGFYASGMSIEDLASVFEKNTFTKEFASRPILQMTMLPPRMAMRMLGYKPYDGLYFEGKFRDYVHKTIGKKRIEQLNIPYAAVVTDVVTGKSCRLTEGDLGEAMSASTAVPELRKPVQIGEKLYCDGGVINNVPVNHAREMGADFVIAVNIDEQLKDRPISDFRALGSMGKQALRIQLAAFDEPSSAKADIVIHPDTTGISLVSFKKGDGKHGIEAGVAAAKAALPEIKRKLASAGIAIAE